MSIKNITLTAIGILLLILATIGIFLPVWPTTPFVIAALGCLSYTPKLKKKILGIPLFREYYESYHSKKSLSTKTVGFSLGFLWSMLFISMFFIKILWIIVLLFFVGMAVTVHILWIYHK